MQIFLTGTTTERGKKNSTFFAFKTLKLNFLSAQITLIPKLKNEMNIRREKGAYCCLPKVHQMLSHISLTFLTWLSANLGEHTLFPGFMAIEVQYVF